MKIKDIRKRTNNLSNFEEFQIICLETDLKFPTNVLSLLPQEWMNHVFKGKARKLHGDKYNYSETIYNGSLNKLAIICPKHGMFEQIASEHLRGKGCMKCSYGITRNKNSLSTQDIILRAIKLHGDKYDYSKTIHTGRDNYITIICPKHGTFEQMVDNHIYHGHGCTPCGRSSKGEERISNFLNKNNIKNEREKEFESLKKFRFDFYLPRYNICIEYDGEQHFRPIKYFGGEQQFKKTVERDKIKNNYCHDNNIKLIRILYTDYNNIERILKKELNN